MCGICGFAGHGIRDEDLIHGAGMTEAIRHRGPDGDGDGTFEHGPLRAWLGHRRLRIIDVTESAHQPMTSADGHIALTYNGEVYNFRELRRELEGRGHRFRSTGDTEVVLRAYEEWGEGFVERIDGMFALAVWDGRRGRLVLARDRTGKKPLFYSPAGDRLTFGSEIKSLLAAPWVPTDIDEERIAEFFTFGYVPWPNTLYAAVKQVPPASVLVYDGQGAPAVRAYWDALPGETPRHRRPDSTQLATIRDVVTRAVGRRLVSDVPLGALLSGGVDSSIVVGLMARATADPVRTFSIGFADDASFDERSYARLVADHFGTEHTEFTVRADAVGLMDRLLWHHDQPFADSSAIPTYIVCQLAREHVTVALNGDGGDEVFGGYDRFVAAAVAERTPRLAEHVAERVAGALPVRHGYYSLRRRLERFTELSGLPVHDRYQSWIAVLDGDLRRQVLAPLLGRGLDDRDAAASMTNCYRQARGLPPVDQIMYANFKTYLPDDLAVKMDRMSMAHSLETRSPFLDTAVVEYLAGIAAARKVGLRRVKPLLRRAFWPLLPAEIWNRSKHGFGVPMGHWFRTGELGTLFADEILAPDARSAAYLSQDVVRTLWDEQRQGAREHGFRLWTILMFERWLRTHSARAAAPPPVAVTA
jgi:asparagine synthase (glutamine-hydrolysing)